MNLLSGEKETPYPTPIGNVAGSVSFAPKVPPETARFTFAALPVPDTAV